MIEKNFSEELEEVAPVVIAKNTSQNKRGRMAPSFFQMNRCNMLVQASNFQKKLSTLFTRTFMNRCKMSLQAFIIFYKLLTTFITKTPNYTSTVTSLLTPVNLNFIIIYVIL